MRYLLIIAITVPVLLMIMGGTELVNWAIEKIPNHMLDVRFYVGCLLVGFGLTFYRQAMNRLDEKYPRKS